MQKKFEKLSDLEVINQMLEQGMDDPEELDDFIFWFHQKSLSLSADLLSMAQKLCIQAYEKRMSQWKNRIKSLPPFLDSLKSETLGIKEIRELDEIITWIQKQKSYFLPPNLQSELQNLEKQAYVRSLNYRQYHQKAFTPEEINDWLNHNPSLEKGPLCELASTLRSQNFYRMLDSFNDSTAAIEWFADKFDGLVIDEINEFLNWYQNNTPFYESIAESTQKLLQKSKEKILKSIQEEIKLEKKRLLENYPFLEALSLGEIILLGQGNFATIISSSGKQNIVIKIPNDPTEYFSPEGYVEFVQEAQNHRAFQLAIAKLKWTKLIPNWLAVPNVFSIPDELPSSLDDMLYTMEKVHGISLKRLAFLRLPQLQDKLGPFSEAEIRHLSELAFDILLKKRKITLPEFHTSSDLIPPLFFEVFTPDSYLGKKFQNLESILVYLKEHEKIIHTDLHSDNILINEETETIYLIDFGIVINHSSQP